MRMWTRSRARVCVSVSNRKRGRSPRERILAADAADVPSAPAPFLPGSAPLRADRDFNDSPSKPFTPPSALFERECPGIAADRAEPPRNGQLTMLPVIGSLDSPLFPAQPLLLRGPRLISGSRYAPRTFSLRIGTITEPVISLLCNQA